MQSAFLVQQPFYDLISQHALFKNLPAVIRLYLRVLDSLAAFLYPDQRTQLADSLTSGLFYTQMRFLIMGSELQRYARSIFGNLQKFFIDLLGTRGDTSGS